MNSGGGGVTENGFSKLDITFPTDGTMGLSGTIASGTFGGCTTSTGALTPVANSPLFTVSLIFGCQDIASTISGKVFTGLATTVNGQLIIAFSDGALAIATNYDKLP